MTEDRTVPQLRKIINKYVKKWKTELFLGQWTVNSTVRDYLSTDNPSPEWKTCARCFSKWQYFVADLEFSYIMMKDMTEEKISEVVLHELVHVVINEMREDGIDHEERVVSHLAMMINRLDGN